jgi:adenylosuccinate lyase
MILLDDILDKCNGVLSRLAVNRERMMENIERQNGLVMAERLMLSLVDSGMPRDEAHEVMRVASIEAMEKNIHLKDVCSDNDSISSVFGDEQLDDLFEPSGHLGVSGELVDNAISIARKMTQ